MNFFLCAIEGSNMILMFTSFEMSCFSVTQNGPKDLLLKVPYNKMFSNFALLENFVFRL